jgi:uncharacterized membrane protein YqiK
MDTVVVGAVVMVILVLCALVLITLLVVTRLFVKVEQGKALVVSTMRNVEVTFVGRVVLPVVHKAELMDISLKTIEIDRRDHEGLICQDNIRADIRVMFYVKVNKTADAVIQVAQSVGCARASDPHTLNELFNAKFSEALKTVGKQLDFVELYTQREIFRDRIIAVIGRDLNGYVLEDAAIDYLEQTPVSRLDPKNILDAQGIYKITELTVLEHVKTNFHENEELKAITKQDVGAREAILELERQQADAEAKQAREIATVRAREQAETLRVEAEERLRSEAARLTTDEQLGVQHENMQRGIVVAEKNKQRVIAVETERIERDRQLEVVNREREVQMAGVAKDKEVEVGLREVADVVRERTAVDKTVAEQEEAIKSLRVVEDAERHRRAHVIAAEAKAQEAVVTKVEQAKADEVAAGHDAKRQLTLAEANRAAADLDAAADIRRADAIKATEAAPGLAHVEVREREAAALEKVGLAEGRAIEAKISGEAKGLHEKAGAMAAMDAATRQHEETRMRIDAMRDVQLREIEARTEIARAQAELISTGLQNADIDIVGGESVFFDRLVGAVAFGKSVDGFVENSTVAQGALAQVAANGGISGLLDGLDTEDLKNVTLSALLGRLLVGRDGPTADGLRALLQQASSLGIADVVVTPRAGNGD